jgi:DNA-binding transcriptional LysR family regulator
MSDTTWRASDTTRMRVRGMLHGAGLNPRTRIEVEDVETALQVVGMGLADTVVHKGVAEQLVPRLAPGAGWVSLRPRMAETLAIVRRAGAPVSPATQLMIELATKRMQEVGEPVKRPRARTT